MKITLIHYTFAPVIGGVETVLREQARLLAQAGHVVTVLCRQGASTDARVRVKVMPGEGADLEGWLRGELARQDVVLMHNVGTMHFDLELTAALWRLAEELTHVRFIAWLHDLAAVNPDYDLPLLEMPCALLARAHPRVEYVAVSSLRAWQFSELTGGTCRVIPNGVDPARVLGITAPVAAFAEAHRLLERDALLLLPARLVRRKNIELALRITAAMRLAGNDAALLVTAPPDAQNPRSASYARLLSTMRAKLALESHAFFLHEHFPVGDADLPGLFTLADALLFPSRQEGFGLPVIEAALHRLPIFCADIAPLDALLEQGVSRFSLDAPPSEIAAQIMRQLRDSPSIQMRKAALRKYAWPAVYRNFLAPLLAETVTRTGP